MAEFEGSGDYLPRKIREGYYMIKNYLISAVSILNFKEKLINIHKTKDSSLEVAVRSNSL